MSLKIFALSVFLFVDVCISASVTTFEKPRTGAPNQNYIGNREPLAYSPFIKLPPGAVKPQGWLLKQLQLQAQGFHGHLAEISEFLKSENNAWLSKDGKGAHGWEELPYWLKGFSNNGYALGDDHINKESRVWIEAAINSRQPNGWFGPSHAIAPDQNSVVPCEDLWPNMVMTFVLQDYYEYSGDQRVIELLTGYFKFVQNIPEDKLLNNYWQAMRAGDILSSVYWLYNRTGDKSLLDLAHKIHRKSARWDKDIIDLHNVNVSQGFREPAEYFLLSGSPEHLAASNADWLKLYQLYGQVPGGMFAGDEVARPGFTDPRQAIETCGIVEMMFSCQVMLRISADPVWADRCEDAAFNSLPASVTADFKALRYLTAPNQVISDSLDKKPELFDGGAVFCMNPHSHRCCQHNVGQGWPYFTQSLWHAAPGNGLAALLYAPCQVVAKVADGRQVTITEKTNYPFDDKIEFSLKLDKSSVFPLYLRVPRWCENARLSINGRDQKLAAKPSSYICIDRKWKNGDSIQLTLPMVVSTRIWKENKNSVSVDRGPLTYSLLINEKYVRVGGTDQWPAWDLHPLTPWNYGLVLDSNKPADSFVVNFKNWPADDQPFAAASSPIILTAAAKKIAAWQVDSKNLVGLLQQSPVLSSEPVEKITLVPMGAARLRLSTFPAIGTAPAAQEWQEHK
jgi:hypothetical protein